MNKFRMQMELGQKTNLAWVVQGRTWFGLWVTIKLFEDPDDPDYARLQAQELIDKLTE